MERKLSVADFATLVGTTSKTIYQRIVNNEELPVNEQLEIVKEKIKGRETTVIITNSAQISLYKEIYGKTSVNNRVYEEILTDDNSYKQVNEVNEPVKINNDNVYNNTIIEQILTLNNEYNNRLERVNDELKTKNEELIRVKSQQLLLEDKAQREGLYLNEINGLKTDNKKLLLVNRLLITVIVILVIGLFVFLTYYFTVKNFQSSVNNGDSQTVQEVVEQPVQTVAPPPVPPVKKVYKKRAVTQ